MPNKSINLDFIKDKYRMPRDGSYCSTCAHTKRTMKDHDTAHWFNCRGDYAKARQYY